MTVSTKQREMLAFIEDFVEENGYPPTYEEIRTGLKISSKSLVNYHLEALENAALLSRSPNTPRGIRLANESETIRVPLMGQATVNNPSVAWTELDIQEVIELTYDIVPSGRNLYAFKAQGQAMLDALVNDGDIVIVQPQTKAQNGEMVAARLIKQGRTTFRRYFRENGHVRLEPDNTTAEAILVKPDEVEVRGKVVAVIRQVD